MRIMLDSNIFISGLVFRGPERRLLNTIYHKEITLVVNDYIVKEIKEVLFRKFPNYTSAFDTLLYLLQLEHLPPPSPATVEYAREIIRDAKDAVILASVMEAKPDLFVSGDLDFHTPEVTSLVKVLTTIEALKLIR